MENPRRIPKEDVLEILNLNPTEEEAKALGLDGREDFKKFVSTDAIAAPYDMAKDLMILRKNMKEAERYKAKVLEVAPWFYDPLKIEVCPIPGYR